MKLFMQLLLVLLFLTFCGVFSLISPKKVLAEFCLVCDPIGGCFQYICDNPEPPGGWPHIVPPSGRDKGVTMRPFLDRYSNQDSHDNRPFIPSYIYDVNNERFEINEDSIQGRKGFSFNGNMTIIPFGAYAIRKDSGKSTCDDDGLYNTTFNMRGSYGYSCEGWSCGEKMHCREYAHIAHVPQAYLDQGFKPAKFYTVEPVSENVKIEMVRTYQGEQCKRPLPTNYGPYFLASVVHTWHGSSDPNWQSFYTSPFYVDETVLVAPTYSYRRMPKTDIVWFRPYYQKQNSNGSWGSWQWFYANSAFTPGTYRLIIRASARGYEPALRDLYVRLITCCKEVVDFKNNRLVCPDSGGSSSLPVRLPEDTDVNNPMSKESYLLRGSDINYTFTWNFQPNFSSSVDIPFRIINKPHPWKSSDSIYSYTLKYLDTKQTVANIKFGHNNHSTTFLFKPDKNRQYQLQIVGHNSSYSDNSFFTFLVGSAKRKLFPTHQSYDRFIDYFFESDQSFIFLPLINQTPTTGKVIGNVYQSPDNTCTGTDAPASVDDWQAFCKRSDGVYQDARKDSSSQFTCWIDDSEDFDVGDPYTVKVEASLPAWQLADCSRTIDVVMVEGSVNVVGPFYIWQGKDPWLQTVDGDVGAQGGLTFSIPLDEYLAIVNQADMPGVVSYNSGVTDFGEGFASTEDWLAETALSPEGRTFEGFKTLLGEPDAEESSFTSLSVLSTRTYFYDEGISLGSGDNLTGGNKIVLLVDGDVTVNADLTVVEGDFLAIIASGNVIFASNVTQAQGIFFAEGQVDFGTAVQTEGQPLGEVQFQAEGSFTALGGFVFGRDLEASLNFDPGEIFTFRPDLVINSPAGLWITPQTWQEVAP